MRKVWRDIAVMRFLRIGCRYVCIVRLFAWVLMPEFQPNALLSSDTATDATAHHTPAISKHQRLRIRGRNAYSHPTLQSSTTERKRQKDELNDHAGSPPAAHPSRTSPSTRSAAPSPRAGSSHSSRSSPPGPASLPSRGIASTTWPLLQNRR